MGKLGHYFKALYDEDLVEEEVLVAWCDPSPALLCPPPFSSPSLSGIYWGISFAIYWGVGGEGREGGRWGSLCNAPAVSPSLPLLSLAPPPPTPPPTISAAGPSDLHAVARHTAATRP